MHDRVVSAVYGYVKEPLPGASSAPHRGDGTHLGIARMSLSSTSPGFGGGDALVEQLHDEER